MNFKQNSLFTRNTGFDEEQADVQGGVNVAFAPLHDLAQLVPVADLLELQVLDRRTGDDHPVEVLLSLIHI